MSYRQMINNRHLPDAVRSLIGDATVQEEKPEYDQKMTLITTNAGTTPTVVSSCVMTVAPPVVQPEDVHIQSTYQKISPEVCRACQKRFFETRGMSEENLKFIDYEFEKALALGVVHCYPLGMEKGWRNYVGLHIEKPLPVNCPNDTEHVVCQPAPVRDYPEAI